MVAAVVVLAGPPGQFTFHADAMPQQEVGAEDRIGSASLRREEQPVGNGGRRRGKAAEAEGSVDLLSVSGGCDETESENYGDPS